MTNQFTGCACDAPTPDRCICEAIERVVATSEPVTLSREDGRWIDPTALITFLRRYNPGYNTRQATHPGVEVVADGGDPR